MTTYIPVALRQDVVKRSGGCCEYCLLSQDDIFLSFEIDHIVPEKHDGGTATDNLCLSCPDCNRCKGSDVGTFDKQTQTLTPLFNPRTQIWADHFELDDFMIVPLTDVGRVTVRLLRLNLHERIEDRRTYAITGVYPCQPKKQTEDEA